MNAVFECVDNVCTMEQVVDIASRGAMVLLFGLTAPYVKMIVQPFEQMFRKEMTSTSSFLNAIADRIFLDQSTEVFTDNAHRHHRKILIVL